MHAYTSRGTEGKQNGPFATLWRLLIWSNFISSSWTRKTGSELWYYHHAIYTFWFMQVIKVSFCVVEHLNKNTLHIRSEIRLWAYKEINIRTNKNAKLQRIFPDKSENFHCNVAHISCLVNIVIHTCAHRETITDKHEHKEGTNTWINWYTHIYPNTQTYVLWI
jgi:hypothetical protein